MAMEGSGVTWSQSGAGVIKFRFPPFLDITARAEGQGGGRQRCRLVRGVLVLSPESSGFPVWGLGVYNVHAFHYTQWLLNL